MTDHEAMTAFCRAQHPRIVGLLRLRADDQTAEELAQDTLVRICRHWETVRDHPRPEAWVATTALNLASSWWRRRLAGRRALARHQAREIGDARGSVDQADAIAVRGAVAGLPARQRQVIALRYYTGLSVRETAAAMRCAEGTVKALTFHAMANLRAAGLEPGADTDDRPPPARTTRPLPLRSEVTQ